MVESPTHPGGGAEEGGAGEWMELTRPLAKRRPPSRPDQHTVTMTGTVKRGNQIGEPVDVELELNDVEFRRLTSREPQSQRRKCGCSLHQGPHVTALSVLFIPLAFVSSLCVSFYYGALTWYNLYIHFSEERTVWHKVSVCPLLILSFPFWTGLTSVGIALYAGVVQISWFLDSWLLAIRDFEKGYFAWVCTTIRLPQCSPYEIVVLDEDDAFPDRS